MLANLMFDIRRSGCQRRIGGLARHWLGLFACLLAAMPITAAASAPFAEEFDGDRLIVLDGDTVALPCKPSSGFRPGCALKVRLKEIDTPETFHPGCEHELVKGLEAKERLRELLSGQTVTVTLSGEIDRYGRSLGWLTFDDRSDVGSILVQEGLALNWQPGGAAKASRIAHWCGAHR